MPSMHPPRDGHACGARGPPARTRRRRSARSCRRAGRSRRARSRPGAGRGPRPARRTLVELAEAVDVEQGDGHLGALALRPGDLELQDAGHRPGVGEAGQRIGEGDALEPLGALRGHRRGPERGDRRRRQVRDRRRAASPPSVPTSCSPGQPKVSTPTQASTFPLLATTSGRSAPVIVAAVGRLPGAAQRPRCGRAPHGGSGAPGW